MRVILAEDSALLREGLIRLLEEEGHGVMAAVGDADALLTAIETKGLPDVVVVDVRMPPTQTDEGLRAALEIRQRWPRVGVLVLSQYVEKPYATKLITSGQEGIGYLLKDRVMRVEEFLEALERVGTGGVAFDPEMIRQILAQPSHPLDGLTPRELEVLAILAEGRTNAAIADLLHVSVSAIEKHVNSIFDKFALNHVTGYSRRVLAAVRYLNTG
jgi:DNA-binding NarL/FixJ family response regulator